MRLFIASMMVFCCAAGYSQEEIADAAPEAPVEITTTDDPSSSVITDSMIDLLDCGCGNKGKSGKPKI